MTWPNASTGLFEEDVAIYSSFIDLSRCCSNFSFLRFQQAATVKQNCIVYTNYMLKNLKFEVIQRRFLNCLISMSP